MDNTLIGHFVIYPMAYLLLVGRCKFMPGIIIIIIIIIRQLSHWSWEVTVGKFFVTRWPSRPSQWNHSLHLFRLQLACLAWKACPHGTTHSHFMTPGQQIPRVKNVITLLKQYADHGVVIFWDRMRKTGWKHVWTTSNGTVYKLLISPPHLVPTKLALLQRRLQNKPVVVFDGARSNSWHLSHRPCHGHDSHRQRKNKIKIS